MERSVRRARSWRAGGVITGLVGALALATGLAFQLSRPRPPAFETVAVQRADIEMIHLVAGDIVGKKETTVECDLEDLPDPDGRIRDPGMLILEVIDEGKRVVKDDVLCRFDSSRYEELARKQKIELERAISEERQATLEREAAEAALRAYRDGEAVQTTQQLQSKIALTRADLERAGELLRWTEQMKAIGYSSYDELAGGRSTVQRLENDLALAERQLHNHQLYTVPKTVHEREVAIENASRREEFGKDQHELAQDRLDKLQDLIKKCTLRAPHDGTVIYMDSLWHAWDPNGDRMLRPGKRAFQHQPLFILPDLAHPVVEALIHEEDLAWAHVGQQARIRIPALGLSDVTGRVTHIDQLPTERWKAFTMFQGVTLTITIDEPPERLLPNLSARVEIITGHHPDALVVPTQALAIEEGQPVCYVSHGGNTVERRPVTIAPANRDQITILTGLNEGERIVTSPGRFRTRPESSLSPVHEPHG